MINSKIKFPLIELTDWVFEGEKEFSYYLNWDGYHYIKEKDFIKQYKRVLVDSNGQILKVGGKNIVRKKGVLFGLVIPPTLVVDFDLEFKGELIEMDELKRKIISRSSENYQITHNKQMTEQEYNSGINNAKTFEEIIRIAIFLDTN